MNSVLHREGFTGVATIIDVERRDHVLAAPGNDMPPAERVLREERLRRAVLAGDEDAWQTLYDQSFAELYRYVRWRSGGAGDLAGDLAGDVVQETWLIAVRRLRGIAANVLRNQLRARAATSRNGAAVEIAHDERRRRDEAEHVAHALAALPENYEAVLRAKYLEQHSVDEIAALWRQTPKAIESLLGRARQAFRAAYDA
jgi:RNA polymerase sigma-70 factor (ECF subfamily)